jgi:hypothetical protein
VRHRATIVQKKIGRPVQFEIKEQSRNSVEAWLPMLRTTGSRYLSPSTKLESTVRYLGIEIDDALNMAEQIEL